MDQSQPFELASVQVGITLNPSIINSGYISCFIKNNSSQLVIAQRPNSVTYYPAEQLLQLHSRPVPAAGSGTVISADTLHPTRICRLRITNTVPWATGQANLAFAFVNSAFPTLLSAFINGNSTALVCDSSNCISLATNAVLNSTTLYPPVSYTVTGGGSYCEEDFPVLVGLSSSQPGVTYQLMRNGTLISTLEGTGSPLSWECLDTATYTIAGVNAAGSTLMNGSAVISFIPGPTVFIYAPLNEICEGDSVLIEAVITNPGNPTYFDWWISRPGGSFLISTNTSSLTYLPQVSDVIHLVCQTSDPCEFQAESNILLLNVIPGATAGQVQGSKTVYLGQTTGNLTLSGFSGEIRGWQKQHNDEGWQDILNVTDTYAELPGATGTWKYRAIVGRENCTPDTSLFATILVLDRLLHLKIYPEGLFNPVTGILNQAHDSNGPRFEPDTADLITLRLIDPYPPYAEVLCINDLPIPTDGLITMPVSPSLNSSYYLSINHRNSLETWSAQPVSFNANVITYNFTTGAEKAYGFNQVERGNQWLMIGGDVNQDGMVNLSDVSAIENSAIHFCAGYLKEDINGDGLIDADDIILADNNAANGYSSMHPYAQEMPMVLTFPAKDITTGSALLSGNVISQGSSPVSSKGICWSFSPNPTINDFYQPSGTGTGNIDCILSLLSIGTHYYFRAYATNLSGTFYGPEYSFTTLGIGGPSPPASIPAITYGYQTYNTVQIGNQVWMRENLNIGLLIGSNQPQTDNGIIEKYCLIDETGYCSSYGGLYQWDEMMQYSTSPSARGICPPGWHLPSNSEWNTLTTYLGGSSVAGGKLKDSGTKRWIEPNSGGTNESGFSALPGGGVFGNSGSAGYWFTSSMCAQGSAMSRELKFNSAAVEENNGCPKTNMSFAMSVRCVMDDSLQLPMVSTKAVKTISENSAVCFGISQPNGSTNIIMRGSCWDTIPSPTLLCSHSVDGNGYGEFSSFLSGLIPNKTYYVRTYATNSAGTTYGNERSIYTGFQGVPCPGIDTLVVDSQVYHTLQIGNQCWMKENLNRGVQVQGYPQKTDNIIEKVCYQNDAFNCEIYGGLYSWDEAMQYTDSTRQGICPDGWHIPSLSDWNILSYTLGGASVAGSKMKDAGTALWSFPNNSTNESGFSAFPGGLLDIDFGLLTYWGGFWSSENGKNFASLYYTSDELGIFQGAEQMISVRCIKDDTIQDPLIETSGITEITQESAMSGGNVLFDGGYPVISKGVCYGYFPNPGLSDFSTNEGTGTGEFTSTLTGLFPSTTYFVRAYVTTAAGTFFGQEFSFITSGENQLPIVQTSPVISLHATGATGGGIVLSNGSFVVTQKGVCWGLNENPTINDSITIQGGGTGPFTSEISELIPDTDYYLRAYAVNNTGISYGQNIQFTTYSGPCPDQPSITIDSTQYPTVQIGNQCWMRDNLNAGIRIGDSISQTDNAIAEKYCYDNLESNCDIYGALYQWHEVMNYQSGEASRGICPEGWHIPSQADYDTLLTYLGGSAVAGGKMKTSGTDYWTNPNTGATNISGFSARGSGLYFAPNHIFTAINNYFYLWSSSGSPASTTTLYLQHIYPSAAFSYLSGDNAVSVRCLRDNIPLITTGSITSVTSNSAVGGGIVSFGNGSAIIDKGLCWGITPSASLENDHTSEGPGFGSFNTVLSNLNPSTVYYVRAYAIKYDGVVYGNEVLFETTAE